MQVYTLAEKILRIAKKAITADYAEALISLNEIAGTCEEVLAQEIEFKLSRNAWKVLSLLEEYGDSMHGRAVSYITMYLSVSDDWANAAIDELLQAGCIEEVNNAKRYRVVRIFVGYPQDEN